MKERELEKLALKEFPNDDWVFWFPKKQEFLRFDIFGCFDFLALNKKTGHINFVQLTTTPNRAARRKKIQAWIEEVEPGGHPKGYFFLWSWDKKQGKFIKERL